MRLLTVGAGASYAECKAAGLPDELCLPLIKNFARKFWADYNPHYVLSPYLRHNGIHPGTDAREKFIELEESDPVRFNVERFFEYAWHVRHLFPGEWENLLYHGILNPLIFTLTQGLWKDGLRTHQMRCAVSVAKRLKPTDAVINLNYDTLFEIGAEQAGHSLAFLPNKVSPSALTISKPHGSLNLVVNVEKQTFAFGHTDWPGSPQPSDGSKNYIGFVPPRLNKAYDEHPVAAAILEATRKLQPTSLIFWGVSFAQSDIGLVEIFKQWVASIGRITVINPSCADAERLPISCKLHSTISITWMLGSLLI